MVSLIFLTIALALEIVNGVLLLKKNKSYPILDGLVCVLFSMDIGYLIGCKIPYEFTAIGYPVVLACGVIVLVLSFLKSFFNKK